MGKEILEKQAIPGKGISVSRITELHESKATNFAKVVSFVCKKPPPADPRESIRREEAERRAAKEKSKDKLRREDEEKRARRKKEEAEKKAREESRKKREQQEGRSGTSAPPPDFEMGKEEELNIMRVQRGNRAVYDCKACGIQSMSAEDAEDHIKEEKHYTNRARQKEKQQFTIEKGSKRKSKTRRCREEGGKREI